MMTEYEEFRKETLYALARNGGWMFLSDIRKRAEDQGMDALDYNLHLRQIQDENVAVRGKTAGTPMDFLTGTPATSPRSYVELTQAGWDWVRESRAAEKLAKLLAEELPPSDPGV